MQSNDLLIDAFSRVKEVVYSSVNGLSDEQLAARPTKDANSVAWLTWHLTRIQDDHIADLMKEEQLWHKTWFKKFNLPLNINDTGYGHSSKEVSLVKASSKTLLAYYDEVHQRTIRYIESLKDEDYMKVVDKRWQPPVTLAVRIISVLSDNLQHAGQAAYVRGLIP